MIRTASIALAIATLITPSGQAAENDPLDFAAAPHRYHERTPNDPFTRVKAQLESGALPLDRSSELATVRSLLKALGIPESSQLLVFSTTSLQLGLISPANPRALYFNQDTYIGWVPGGRIEVVSIDPELGGVFYIFDVPHDASPIRADRSGRCMNCHAGEDAGFVPGLVIKSVLPGPSGGSLESFREVPAGHATPYTNRFGGWHVTGADGFSKHWGNLTGRLSQGNLVRISNPPGDRYRADRYPVPSSDFLAHCIHEHQIGFFNRAIAAGYRVRSHLHSDGATLAPAHRREVDADADSLARYLLFSDEAPFPVEAVSPAGSYQSDFLRDRRIVNGHSLKDLNLKTRLFQNRCSYLITSEFFTRLPDPLKSGVVQRIQAAVRDIDPDSRLASIPAEERRILRELLADALPEFRLK
jgi:hypothetical protein